MIGVYLLLDLFPVQCFSLNRTTHAQCGTHGCQDCRCKVPQKLNKPRFVLLCHNSFLKLGIRNGCANRVESRACSSYAEVKPAIDEVNEK